jgi:hypothetical protein
MAAFLPYGLKSSFLKAFYNHFSLPVFGFNNLHQTYPIDITFFDAGARSQSRFPRVLNRSSNNASCDMGKNESVEKMYDGLEFVEDRLADQDDGP